MSVPAVVQERNHYSASAALQNVAPKLIDAILQQGPFRELQFDAISLNEVTGYMPAPDCSTWKRVYTLGGEPVAEAIVWVDKTHTAPVVTEAFLNLKPGVQLERSAFDQAIGKCPSAACFQVRGSEQIKLILARHATTTSTTSGTYPVGLPELPDGTPRGAPTGRILIEGQPPTA